MFEMTLKEKLETMKALDTKVIDLIEDKEALADEIEWADNLKEGNFDALIKLDRITTTFLGSPVTPISPTETLVRPSGPYTSCVWLPKLQLLYFDEELMR